MLWDSSPVAKQRVHAFIPDNVLLYSNSQFEMGR